METWVFRIRGMDCAEEVRELKRELAPLVGGEDRLRFDLLAGTLTAKVPAGTVGPAEIESAVARLGLAAERVEPDLLEKEGSKEIAGRATALTVAASALLAAAGFTVEAVARGGLLSALASSEAGETSLLAAALYGAAALCGLRFVLPRALAAAWRLRPDMHLLMTIAVVGAASIGAWFEAAAVAFLFALALELERWSVTRARRAVAALLELSPPTARLSRVGSGGEEVVPVDRVEVGSTIVVHPGERIPLDGTVSRGAGAVDESPITGESVPVEKKPGDPVYAGSLNGDGLLEILTTKKATDTLLARIVRRVGEARSRRAPVERWVDRFAEIYTPAVVGLAVAVALLPPLGSPLGFASWFYRALVLLVIACPCALVISTPVSIVASLTAAARRGVLVQGGAYIELPASVRAFAFDKTGTLSEGRPRVVAARAVSGLEDSRLFALAFALARGSGHPLAEAIASHAAGLGIEPEPASAVRAVPGKGMEGEIGGRLAWLGSKKMLEERAGKTTLGEGEAPEGATLVFVGIGSEPAGWIALADRTRPEAAPAVRRLRALGVETIVLLTGDREEAARRVGAEAGVDEIHASLLPEDKVRIVDELRRRYGRVAMVGDGINDAPAMAEADLGIAMGAGGSDAAIEASDIALVSDDLGKLPWLVAHSKRTLAIVRQNIGFALGVKAVFFGLGLAGAASLWAAVAADMGASLLVVFNGLRLLGGGREQPARSGLYSRPEGAAGVPDLRASSGARPRQVSRSTASKLAR